MHAQHDFQAFHILHECADCSTVHGSATSDALACQVETGADALLAADVSPTGELVAFGSAAGMVHTWAFAPQARVNAYARAPETPPQRQHPPPRIAESEPWAAAPRFPCMQARHVGPACRRHGTLAHHGHHK